MPKANKIPSIRFLNECFELNKESPSGLIWKTRPFWHFTTITATLSFNKRFPGKTAGSSNNTGYWIVALVVNNKQCRFLAHRIIYSMLNNIQLTEHDEIDHKDRNGLNNNPKNLRICDRRGNILNRGMSKNNKSGYTGVFKYKGKYKASIMNNGVEFVIGYYATAKDASDAYQDMARLTKGKFNPINQ